MARWCVDASAVLATLLSESTTLVARAFWAELTTADDIIAPQVLFPECTSVLRRRVTEGVISVEEGRALIDEMLRLPIQIQDSKDQFRMSFDWASRMRRVRTHDLQYLAISELAHAPIVTTDSGMRQTAADLRLPVRLLR